MYKVILVPLDGSKSAESILPQVKSMASLYNAAVVLLKVEESSILLGHDEVIDLAKYQEERRNLRKEAETYLSGIQEKLRTEDIEAKIIIENGVTVNTILEVADREGADLVAMASHGWSIISRDFYGSTAVGVMQRIDRPLLIIRSPRAA
jgi:nucleotide-binding universal stress UspA family protein